MVRMQPHSLLFDSDGDSDGDGDSSALASALRHSQYSRLKDEWAALHWLEDFVEFSRDAQDRLRQTNTPKRPAECYTQIADWLEKGILPKRHPFNAPYFQRLSSAMRTWTQVWQRSEAGTLALAPPAQSRSLPRCALLLHLLHSTDLRALRASLRYYALHFPARDTFILDPSQAITVDVSEHIASHIWTTDGLRSALRRLMNPAGINNGTAAASFAYSAVLVAGIDEIFVPDQSVYPSGLAEYIAVHHGGVQQQQQQHQQQQQQQQTQYHPVAQSFDLVHDPNSHERPVNFNALLLHQRSTWTPSPKYNRRLFITDPSQTLSPSATLPSSTSSSSASSLPDTSLYLVRLSRITLATSRDAHTHFADDDKWRRIDLDRLAWRNPKPF